MYHDLSPWAYIIITLCLTHVTIISVTLFLHRCQAHKSLALHPLVSHFFRFWLWLTTGITTRQWVAVHRKHHARVESAEDPHSPQHFGIRKVLFEGAELYRAEARQASTLQQYGHDTPRDWLERNLYSRFPHAGISLLLMINLVLFGVIGVTIWAIQMLWIPFFAAGVINGIGHWWGYRNFETADTSANIMPLAALIGGEELHNNHHAFAASARFSSKWYEIDLGWWYVCLLRKLGLARVKKVAPKPVIDPARQSVDTETVKAVISGRLYVLSHYAKDVIRKVYKEEKARANAARRRMLRRSKSLLICQEQLLDANGRQRLEQILADCQALQVVYDYSRRLQHIWQQRTASQESLVEALQEWCRQAEQTGIKALEEFAGNLRGYRLQEVQ